MQTTLVFHGVPNFPSMCCALFLVRLFEGTSAWSIDPAARLLRELSRWPSLYSLPRRPMNASAACFICFWVEDGPSQADATNDDFLMDMLAKLLTKLGYSWLYNSLSSFNSLRPEGSTSPTSEISETSESSEVDAVLGLQLFFCRWFSWSVRLMVQPFRLERKATCWGSAFGFQGINGFSCMFLKVGCSVVRDLHYDYRIVVHHFAQQTSKTRRIRLQFDQNLSWDFAVVARLGFAVFAQPKECLIYCDILGNTVMARRSLIYPSHIFQLLTFQAITSSHIWLFLKCSHIYIYIFVSILCSENLQNLETTADENWSNFAVCFACSFDCGFDELVCSSAPSFGGVWSKWRSSNHTANHAPQAFCWVCFAKICTCFCRTTGLKINCKLCNIESDWWDMMSQWWLEAFNRVRWFDCDWGNKFATSRFGTERGCQWCSIFRILALEYANLVVVEYCIFTWV